ncbi:hypothetical protein M758_4G013900 [Ceratodon purpureus]|nr:hypothetical protein M758_4G013900 [Ceratodon purpureus]
MASAKYPTSRSALWSLLIALVLGVSSLTAPAAATRTGATAGLSCGFYRHSCPDAENIVYNSMQQSYNQNKVVAPGVLRIAFHDCFVRGCDASVLLLGPDTERSALFNKGLQAAAFDALDAAKIAVNKACPGVVSAADVIQFAARDSVKLAGGLGWDVPAGRRDGRVSRIEEASTPNLPTPNMTVPDLLEVFARKGLSANDLVVLSGAHTIGHAPCLTFDNRLQTSPVDPTLAPSFAAQLKKQCPAPNNGATQVDLDSTAMTFDPQYYKDIARGRGLLTSDQSLLADGRTKRAVYSNRGTEFYTNFGKAMVTMSKIEVLTGSAGEIRRHIAYVN